MENSIDKKYTDASKGIEKLIAVTNIMNAAGYETEHQNLREALVMVEAFDNMVQDLINSQVIL